jgi:hypothetical protein
MSDSNAPKKVSALSNLIFFKTFGSEENKDILAGLARDFFGIESGEITILTPYDVKVYAQMQEGNPVNVLRHTSRDVTARFETADLTMELQVRKDEYFDVRSLKYAFDVFSGNYNEIGAATRAASGSPYATLRPVFSLNILHYRRFEDTYPLRIFELYDKNRGLSLDKDYLKVAYFELGKPCTETAELGYWRDYFLGNELPARTPEYIRKAARLLEYVNLTDEERKMMDREEWIRADIISQNLTEVHDAERAALARGRTEGRAKGQASLIEAMRKQGISESVIEKVKATAENSTKRTE